MRRAAPHEARRVLIVVGLCLCGLARAQTLKERFNFKLSLTGFYLAEQQGAVLDPTTKMPAPELGEAASSIALGYAELRTVFDARRIPGQLELHLDARARISADDWSAKPGDAAYAGAHQTIARGYLGGREYEVRQAWLRRRGDRIDFIVGRQLVAEADALRLDGARLIARLGPHWDVSAFAGGYPNPYSRSLLTDYLGGFGVAGGADSSYRYDRIWGSMAVVSSYLSGTNAGGPLAPGFIGMTGAAGVAGTETPRTFVTWTNYLRVASWLDLFHDLVVDVTGSAGVQLTRADVLTTAHAGRFVTVRAGYDHLSSIAIEMYLTSLLNSRAQFVANTIENNLIVERTGRDEGRLQLAVSARKLSVYAEGRVRHRSLVNVGADPQFANNPAFPDLAFDGTLGVRDRGSLAGMRLGTWASYLADYRAESIIADVDLGRSFFAERLSIDLSFLYAHTKDRGADVPAASQCVPAYSGVARLNTCWGRREGSEYEVGATVTASPWKRWFALVEYRLVIDDTSGSPNILTHMVLARLEARY